MSPPLIGTVEAASSILPHTSRRGWVLDSAGFRPDRTFLAHGANLQVRHRTGKAKMLARKRRLARPIFIVFNFTFGYSRSLTEVREFPYNKLFFIFFFARIGRTISPKNSKRSGRLIATN